MRLKQEEKKSIRFAITDSSGDAVDLTGSSFTFDVRRDNPQGKTVITVGDSTFDKTSIATGVVSVELTTVHTNQTPGQYIGELKITLASGSIHKSSDIDIDFEEAITT